MISANTLCSWGQKEKEGADMAWVGHAVRALWWMRSGAGDLSFVFIHMGTLLPPNSTRALPVLRDGHQQPLLQEIILDGHTYPSATNWRHLPLFCYQTQ